MASSLGRMFALASAQKNAAIENFTTEALAAVLRDDPTPLLQVLGETGPVRLARTQVPVDGGQLDLLLDLDEHRVAIEVKVDAGASGEQLACYLTWVAADPTRRRLVVLSRHDVRKAEHAAASWITWHALRRAARSTGAPGAPWRDLCAWLEERHMADDFEDPISSDEARSLGGAHMLLRKSPRLLAPACAHLTKLWPASKWPASEERVAARFAKWPSFTVDTGSRFRAGLTLGVYFEDGDPWLGMWVWANPKRVDARDSITTAGKRLGPMWHSDPGSCELLGAYARWEPALDLTAWWISRANELHVAGVLDAIEGAGQPDDGDLPP